MQQRSRSLYLLFSQALILTVIAVIWANFGKIEFKFGLFWPNLAIGVGLGVFTGFLTRFLYLHYKNLQDGADKTFDNVLKHLKKGELFLVLIIVSLSEELLFRGVALQVWGLLISSLVFAFIHWHNWHYVVWTFVLSIIFGFSNQITGSLLVPMAAHVVHNLIIADFSLRKAAKNGLKA